MADTPPEKDLGAGEVSEFRRDLSAQEIRSAIDARRFRFALFWLGFTFIVAFYGFLLYFVFLRCETGNERLVISGLLAAIPTILILALSRHVFKVKSDDKETDSVSIWQGLFKELVDVLKMWVGKK